MKKHKQKITTHFRYRIVAGILALVLTVGSSAYITGMAEAVVNKEKNGKDGEGATGYSITSEDESCEVKEEGFAGIVPENRAYQSGQQDFSRKSSEDDEISNVSGDIREMKFKYETANDILTQYISKDGKAVKILNNNVLYSCDISTGHTETEHTFPKAEYTSTGSYYGGQNKISAFICEEAGLLYFGYNSYYNAYSENEIMNVVVYDMERGEVVRSIQKEGHILKSVGADKKGNIYVGTNDYKKTVAEGQNNSSKSLIIMSENGTILTERDMAYPINEFSGFCTDGTFYYIDEFMAYSAYGYGNLMGRLMKGKFANGEVSLPEQYMTYAKNISFGNYQKPVEILNDEYLVTFTGEFYPLSKIGDGTWSRALYAEKKLEMGGEYDYIHCAGVNSVIVGDVVYTLYNNNTIFTYSMADKKRKKQYQAKGKIFNLKRFGDGLLALETDGTHFFYEIIKSSDMKVMNTVTYNMDTFSVYNNRSKNGIIKKFLAAAPKDYSATLYAKNGSGKAPYKESTLTTNTKENALKLSNYYRWLAGLSTLSSSSSEVWSNAAKGAVLLHASDFSHSSSRPKDMSEAFYRAAAEGTSSSSIAMNHYKNQYKIIDTIRLWMNDNDYMVTGHRNNFLTRNATKIAYGFFGNYVCQTVEYTGDPNPLGTAVKNNEAAYAWPAAGDFPAEELSKAANWTVNLNTDKLNLSTTGLKVTITDLATGKSEYRTSSADGLASSSYWGKFISFAPPKLNSGAGSYAGKRYKITFSNLVDGKGMPAQLVYTVNFFKYSGTHVIDGVAYHLDEYGKKGKSASEASTLSLSNTKKGVKISWRKKKGATKYIIYRNGKKLVTTKGISYIDKKAKKNGTKYRYKVAAYKGSEKIEMSGEKTIYYLSQTKLIRVKGRAGGKLNVHWKKNKKASGYQIRYVAGKKKKQITVTGTKKTGKTVSGLKKGKRYKVSVRAYKKMGKGKSYSPWSKSKKVKVKK